MHQQNALPKPQVVPQHIPPLDVVSHDHPLANRRFLIISDAWEPQINGVVTTLRNLSQELSRKGYDVHLLTPENFATVPSFYPGVQVALPFGVSGLIEQIQPHRVFIATEGSLGLAGRRYCRKRNIPFATSFTTRWPEYFQTHLKFPPVEWGYQYLRWFHAESNRTFVATQSLIQELEAHGFKNLALWSRGVDTDLFRPVSPEIRRAFLPDCPRPFYVYVGRVSREKNLQAFLSQPLPGTKIVIGQGPDLEELKREYPQAVFTGARHGQELANTLGSCDVLVFPSKTDTFGLVMLEALACGLPVVAFNVTGPKDVIPPSCPVGFLAESDKMLYYQALRAWKLLQGGQITIQDCRQHAMQYSWESVTQSLIERMPLHDGTNGSMDKLAVGHFR